MSNNLTADHKAPSFIATDVFGNKVDSAEYNDGYTLLAFLRYSGCPWCNLALHRLSLEYKQLKKENTRVIAFVQSEKDSVIENVFDRHKPMPQFPIIADQAMKYYKKYDVDTSIISTIKDSITHIPYWVEATRKQGFKQGKLDGEAFLVPAWFLVNNATGKIIESERGVSFLDHESFIKIYDTVGFGE